MVSAGIGGKLSALCLGKTELNAAGPPGGPNPIHSTSHSISFGSSILVRITKVVSSGWHLCSSAL